MALGLQCDAGPIHALLTARDGTLWIGAYSGLASWKAGKLTQYPELAGYQVSALLEDRERTVWAGSFGIPTGRLCAIRAGRATCEDAAVGGGPAGFYEDRKGNLWAGVPNGPGDGSRATLNSIRFQTSQAAFEF